jgi:hypothetical protein
LGKIAFIDNDWMDDAKPDDDRRSPSDGEFWLVDVVHETRRGSAQGCFLVRPIRLVAPADLSRLPPGMYEEQRFGDCLVLEPKIGGIHWILPLRHKHLLRDVYAVVIRQ